MLLFVMEKHVYYSHVFKENIEISKNLDTTTFITTNKCIQTKHVLYAPCIQTSHNQQHKHRHINVYKAFQMYS